MKRKKPLNQWLNDTTQLLIYTAMMLGNFMLVGILYNIVFVIGNQSFTPVFLFVTCIFTTIQMVLIWYEVTQR